MKKLLLFINLILLVVNAAFTQVYTFTGTGNWTNPSNWSNGIIPPSVLPAGSSIIIYPIVNGECILDTIQTISSGASLTIQPGKKFTIPGNLLIPAVLTTAITTIGETTAIVAGNITKDGGSAVTERGICYGISPHPTIDSMKVVSGAGIGIFTVNLSSLIADTLYYVRAYATNSAGTDYGNEIIFTPTTPPAYKLYGLGLSPYYDGQNPDLGAQISEQQIAYLLQKAAPYTNWVRSYGFTNGLEKIGLNAHNLSLKVAGGAWLGSDSAVNQLQISNLIAAGLAGEIDVAIVGNEFLINNAGGVSQLIAYINQVKAALPGIPVTTGDIYQNYLSNPDLISAVDVLYVHIYPFWEGQPFDCATYFIDNTYSRLQAVSQGKEIVVAETGWPSDGDLKGKAIPSPANASTFFLHFTSWARAKQVNYFYFEAFDETWKQIKEGNVGPHWGLWEKNGGAALKPGMDSVFNGVIRPNNWQLDTATILADTVSISFTFVPAIGVQQDVEGIVKGVLPSDYNVAFYIYINGVWYTKPTYAQPLTPLRCDGTFSCYINDTQETIIRAYLVPAGYNPPVIGNQPTLPPEIEQNAIAWIEVIR